MSRYAVLQPNTTHPWCYWNVTTTRFFTFFPVNETLKHPDYMKKPILPVWVIALAITLAYCSTQKRNAPPSETVYKSDDLIIIRIGENAYRHTSFKQTNDFGNVPCNGLLVCNHNEAIVFDTPTNDKSSEALIKWIRETLHCKINAVIPTHFHDDCLGGLNAFEAQNIASYASFKTIALAKENHFAVPRNGFQDSIVLQVGDAQVLAKFMGEGHTKDNVVGYFPAENILFGGCLIKSMHAGKGYLGDANLAEWSNTVERVKKTFPDVKVVVPGHGEHGDKKLLDFTINLFKPGATSGK
jgi:metallo-beta-lactamase class B